MNWQSNRRTSQNIAEEKVEKLEEKVERVEEKAEHVKVNLEKEILTVGIELERERSTARLPGIRSNRIKPPTYDAQTPSNLTNYSSK